MGRALPGGEATAATQLHFVSQLPHRILRDLAALAARDRDLCRVDGRQNSRKCLLIGRELDFHTIFSVGGCTASVNPLQASAGALNDAEAGVCDASHSASHRVRHR